MQAKDTAGWSNPLVENDQGDGFQTADELSLESGTNFKRR
jgi:hypothetical protein